MATVAQLVSNVLTEGNFDATEAQAIQWLSRRQSQMCARTRCFRKKLSIGPTVKEQVGYSVPAEAIEIREVQVNGYPYDEGRHRDLAEGRLHYLWLSNLYLGGFGGIYTRDYDSSGKEVLALFPTPTEAGLEVAIWATCRPPELKVGEDTTIKIPDDFSDALVAGAIATGLTRLEARPDLATTFEQIYSAGCNELEQQVDKRYRGSGPAGIRVVGINA